MKQDWKPEIIKLWQRMVSRKDSEFFREPVDWEGLGLLDYPTIITKPMDLKTLKQNLDKGVYARSSDFAVDVRLIFSNAMTYNTPGSRVYNHAKSLGDFWEQCWAQLTSAEGDVDRPPSKEILFTFVEKAHYLQPEELAKLLYILEEHCPNSIIKKPETSEVDVNTDLITGRGYFEANKYIDSLLLVDEKGAYKGATDDQLGFSPGPKSASDRPKDDSMHIGKRRKSTEGDDLTSPVDTKARMRRVSGASERGSGR